MYKGGVCGLDLDELLGSLIIHQTSFLLKIAERDIAFSPQLSDAKCQMPDANR
jgi:hypothetical protein